MSGCQVSRSNTYSCSSHPSNTSFPPRTPGRPQYPNTNDGNSQHTSLPSGSEFSASSGHCLNLPSPKFPEGRICMGRPYNSRCVEASALVRGPKVTKKPTHSSPHCLLCTDRPSCPSSPTFLDQLIKGISYLDRSINVFSSSSSFPKTLSLPQLVATYLERAANSLYLDETEPVPLRNSIPSTNLATIHHSPANNCLVPSTRDTNGLQCLGGSSGLPCQQWPHIHTFSAEVPQEPEVVKLPEISLFGNGFLSLGRLPKFWEAIRSGWNAREPTCKPEGWW